MPSLRSRALYVLALGGCAALSLRPPSAAERALYAALAPLRLLSEVAAPVGLLRARSVRAAERHVAGLLAEEQAERRALGADQRRFVLPHEPELRSGRAFVVAEVVGRVERDVDRLAVRVFEPGGPLAAGLEPGLPVVVGDHYVGRVHALTRDGALVDLVTRSDGFVGAVLGDGRGRVRMVVGGLGPRPSTADPLLAVRSPERGRLEPGPVRVDESLAGTPHAELASGFVLGDLLVLENRPTERSYAVRSPIDFSAGVFQVAIVRPPDDSGTGPRSDRGDPLEDGRWRRARALSCGVPLAGREGVVLDVGASRGISVGAAIVAGARLVGRVARAGPLASWARLLGDPGLAVPAVARIEGLEEPLILGTLVSLGSAPGAQGGRTVRMHWDRGWPAGDPGTPLRARLFTGAGAGGVPPGLVLGDAWLPRQPGPCVLDVELAIDPRDLGRLWVRRAGSALDPAAGEEAP